MIHIINQLGYVLTPEFALRLLILHEKCSSNHSLVLSGDTGIGKTELLELFSALINSNTNQIPDILEEFRILVNKYTTEKAYQLDRKGNDIGGQIRDSVVRIVNQYGKEVYSSPLTLEIVQFVKITLRCYPRLKRTPFLERVADPSKPVRETIQTNEDLVKLIEEVTHARFQKLYYRILMHQKFSAKELRRTIHNIVADSGALKSPDIKIIIFIDEFNTALDAMGLIKEVFCDQTMDGSNSAIPKNIFWVAAMNPRKLLHYLSTYLPPVHLSSEYP